MGIALEVRAALEREGKPDDSGLPKIQVADVVRVVDGDTRRVKTEDGGEVSLRLHNIDAPEMAQSAGKRSKDRLQYLMLAGCGDYSVIVKGSVASGRDG